MSSLAAILWARSENAASCCSMVSAPKMACASVPKVVLLADRPLHPVPLVAQLVVRQRLDQHPVQVGPLLVDVFGLRAKPHVVRPLACPRGFEARRNRLRICRHVAPFPAMNESLSNLLDKLCLSVRQREDATASPLLKPPAFRWTERGAITPFGNPRKPPMGGCKPPPSPALWGAGRSGFCA